jgi:hypothetical protein
MGIQFNGNTDTISTNDGTLNVTPQTTFGGEVGIAGTLTYEDVTNIDSVGIITARSGIRVGANGIKRETVHLDAGDSGANYLRFTNTGTGNGVADGFNVGINADENALLWNFENKDTIFATNNLERLRITSAGKVGINTNNPSHNLDISVDGVAFPSAAGSTILRLRNSAGSATLSIDANAGNVSAIQFGDTAASSQGTVSYNHSSNHLQFNTSGSERARISSDGHLGINTDFTGSQLWRAGKRFEIFGGSGNVTGELHLGANRGDGQQSVGSINFFDNTQDSNHKHVALIEVDKAGSTSNKRGGDIIFYTKKDNVASPTESMRITKDGYITKPRQAMFEARGNNTAFSAQSPLPYPVSAYNIGNCYNTSTYKFTAPVNGYYQVMAHVIPTDYTAGGNNVELYVIDNHGTRYFLDRKLKSTNYSSNNFSVGGTRIIYADATDTLWLQFHAISGTPKVETASYFSAILVA